jgi:3-phosphoshikimate 1-carboxyvinyltransferase
MNVASAQVKSCVLLAGLNAEGKTTVKNPKAQLRAATSRNHTELMLQFLGADLEEKFIEFEDGFVQEISIQGYSNLTATNLSIPSDISSAAFFLVAASCLKNSDLILKNVGLNSTRRAIVDVLQSFGASIEFLNQTEICNETVGDLRVSGGGNLAPKGNQVNKIEGDIIANLIDEVPILAVFGTQLENGLEIRNAQELRVKESDRIKAVVENLRAMNADVEEFADGLRIGKSSLMGTRIDSFGDHRIAMAFSVAGLMAQGETEIVGAESTAVSFPEFFQKLNSVTE